MGKYTSYLESKKGGPVGEILRANVGGTTGKYANYLAYKSSPQSIVDQNKKIIDEQKRLQAEQEEQARLAESRAALIQTQNDLAERTQQMNAFSADDSMAGREQLTQEAFNLGKQAEKQDYVTQTDLLPVKYNDTVINNTTKNGLTNNIQTAKGNFDIGRLTQDIAKMQTVVMDDPSEESKKLLTTLKTTYDNYIERNRKAMFYTDKNGEEKTRGNLLTNTLASFMPQLIDQVVAQLPVMVAYGIAAAATGGASAAATGGLTSSKTLGLGTSIAKNVLKYGRIAAAGKESYNVVKGSAYDNLLQLGIPAETARQLSQTEAFKSSLVEMADTFAEFKFLGINNFLSAVAGMGTKATVDLLAKTGMKKAANSALTNFLKALGMFALDTASEYAQESIQQGFTHTSEKLGLASIGVQRNVTPEQDARDRHSAGMEGAKLNIVTGGLPIAATTLATGRILANQSKIQEQATTPAPVTPANTPVNPTVTPAITPATTPVVNPINSPTVTPVTNPNVATQTAEKPAVSQPVTDAREPMNASTEAKTVVPVTKKTATEKPTTVKAEAPATQKTYKHFTTQESADKLNAGETVQTTVPIVTDGQPAISLSTATTEPTKNADATKTVSVEYQIADDARKVVIDFADKVKFVAQKVGASPTSPEFWTGLRKLYDVVEIRNTKMADSMTNETAKAFFKNAGGDQIIVLNTDKARVVTQTTDTQNVATGTNTATTDTQNASTETQTQLSPQTAENPENPEATITEAKEVKDVLAKNSKVGLNLNQHTANLRN